jgi:glycosyltransferase involved in cell wall biosynthesis
MRLQAEHRPLIVFSHLRWDFVWQRPQHIVSRLAATRPTWFVEEPKPIGDGPVRLRHENAGPVTRIWLEVPGAGDEGGYVYFEDAIARDYGERLFDLIPARCSPIAWIYTPLALPMARAFDPGLLVYDVMDDLASFKNAPPVLRLRQRQALAEADLVFAGGRSLFQSVAAQCPDRSFLFASGVEPEHYASARRLRRRHVRPVAGYVGVLDERIDLDLVAGLARALPEWDIEMVGPLAKITAFDLPKAPNLYYPGPRSYRDLPRVMAGFDVALMPFALNQATRSISPTKTLEYLAAGLPVVSTRVPDVVASYPAVVDLQDDAAGFALACRRVLGHSMADRDRKLAPLLARHHWDAIAAGMAGHMNRLLAEREPAEAQVIA